MNQALLYFILFLLRHTLIYASLQNVSLLKSCDRLLIPTFVYLTLSNQLIQRSAYGFVQKWLYKKSVIRYAVPPTFKSCSCQLCFLVIETLIWMEGVREGGGCTLSQLCRVVTVAYKVLVQKNAVLIGIRCFYLENDQGVKAYDSWVLHPSGLTAL